MCRKHTYYVGTPHPDDGWWSSTDVVLHKGSFACCFPSAGVTFAAGETYDIRVIVESNQMVLYVDDVSVGTASWEGETDFASEVSVYVGDPWYTAARVTLSHICLKDIALPSPVPTATYAPTTARPTMLDLLLTDKLIASDAEPGDYFGYSVAISGETVVAGAPYDSNSGSAYIFRMTDGGASSVEVAKLTSADAAADDFFGHSVGIDGNNIVIGAPYNDDAGSYSGSVYVFRTTDGGATYGQVANLTASDAAAGDNFGWSVAIDGSTVLVGATDHNGGRGAVYVFRTTDSGATYSQVVKLTASEAASGDEFGRSVAIDGNTIVVGTSYKESVYVFLTTDGGATYGQVAKLTAADVAAGDNFGWSVAIDGNTVVVGAYGDDDGGADSGSAYVSARPMAAPHMDSWPS